MDNENPIKSIEDLVEWLTNAEPGDVFHGTSDPVPPPSNTFGYGDTVGVREDFDGYMAAGRTGAIVGNCGGTGWLVEFERPLLHEDDEALRDFWDEIEGAIDFDKIILIEEENLVLLRPNSPIL